MAGGMSISSQSRRDAVTIFKALRAPGPCCFPLNHCSRMKLPDRPTRSTVGKSRYLSVLTNLLFCLPLTALVAAPPSKPPSLDTRVAALEALVATLQSDLAAQSALLVGVSRLNDPNTTKDTLRFSGLNNETSGVYASVSGGQQHLDSGQNSSISGGFGHLASGGYSSVSGGNQNIASGEGASVSGGYFNEASGNSSAVSGGESNAATEYASSVSGGLAKTATAVDCTTAGNIGTDCGP